MANSSPDPVPDPAPPPTPPPTPPDWWDRLGARIPILNNLAQFVLITLLGTFAKCSVDDYTRNLERTKRVDDLTTALSTQETDRDITKRNLTLVTLDRLYSNPNPSWWQRHFGDAERQADDSLIFNIAEEVYRARLATPVGPGDTAQVLARLILAARIMTRRDSARGRAFLRSFRRAAVGKTRSAPDTSQAVSSPPAAGLPIAPGNAALLQTAAPPNAAGGAEAEAVCYIQFRTFRRAVAQGLQQSFQRVGWTAPGVERVAGTYGCSVRYYFADDEARAQRALRLSQEFAQTLPSRPRVALVSLVSKNLEGKVPHGQIEVWLSPGAGR